MRFSGVQILIRTFNFWYLMTAHYVFKYMVPVCMGIFLTFVFPNLALGQIDGFTEPFRSIELASDESGAIASLEVEEGQLVHAQDVVARLDVRVQELQLEIATRVSETRSAVFAAEETLKKRQIISDRLKTLRSNGHASQSEIIRAQMELSIAQAELLSAQEAVAVHEIEKRRAQVQLDRRTIVAPFDGIVAKIHRREGEYLSPLRPEIVTIIQADRLLATFAIPGSELNQFKIGKEFHLQIGERKRVSASVFRIGVQTDAQSGTVEVKLVIENRDLQIRSGESCLLNF